MADGEQRLLFPTVEAEQQLYNPDYTILSQFGFLLTVMSENSARALRGELYYAFTPELVKARRRCAAACNRFNNADLTNRRTQVELWRA
jgi:hypothetical protein